MATYKINYGFITPSNNKLRNATRIVNAANQAAAQKAAATQIAKEVDWFKINSCTEIDSTRDITQ